MYHDGKGVVQSNTEAAKWYRKAAEQGYAQAQYNLGIAYLLGRAPQNRDLAIKWFKKSAAQGNQNAIAALKQLGVQ